MLPAFCFFFSGKKKKVFFELFHYRKCYHDCLWNSLYLFDLYLQRSKLLNCILMLFKEKKKTTYYYWFDLIPLHGQRWVSYLTGILVLFFFISLSGPEKTRAVKGMKQCYCYHSKWVHKIYIVFFMMMILIIINSSNRNST